MKLQIGWIQARIMTVPQMFLLLLIPFVGSFTVQDPRFGLRQNAGNSLSKRMTKTNPHRIASNVHGNKASPLQVRELHSDIVNISDPSALSNSKGTGIPKNVRSELLASNGHLKGISLERGNRNRPSSQAMPQLDTTDLQMLTDNLPNHDNAMATGVRSLQSKSSSEKIQDFQLIESKKRSYDAPGPCQLDETRIEMSFSREEQGLSSPVVCTGNVLVKKCEGGCESEATPSVNNYNGIQRTCSCCKETGLREQAVTLYVCKSGENVLHGRSITRTFREPTGCACTRCNN